MDKREVTERREELIREGSLLGYYLDPPEGFPWKGTLYVQAEYTQNPGCSPNYWLEVKGSLLESYVDFTGGSYLDRTEAMIWTQVWSLVERYVLGSMSTLSPSGLELRAWLLERLQPTYVMGFYG